MLGLHDPWIITAFILCVASAAACVIVGIAKWNTEE